MAEPQQMLEEPIVPVRIAPPKAKGILERTGAVLLVNKPTSYLRSLTGLAVNVVLAVSGPLALMVHEGRVGDWHDLRAFPVVVSLAPTVAAVVRQWLSRSPEDVHSGMVRDAITGK